MLTLEEVKSKGTLTAIVINESCNQRINCLRVLLCLSAGLLTSFVECEILFTWFQSRRTNLFISGKFIEFSQGPLSDDSQILTSPWQPIYSNISVLVVIQRHRDVRGSHYKWRLTRPRGGNDLIHCQRRLTVSAGQWPGQPWLQWGFIACDTHQRLVNFRLSASGSY